MTGLDREPSDESLHEVRKRAKRARYAAELGRGLFGKPARRLAKRLERIQDELGELQDTVVAEEYLASLADRGLLGSRRLSGGRDRVRGAGCTGSGPSPVAIGVEIRKQEAASPMAQVGSPTPTGSPAFNPHQRVPISATEVDRVLQLLHRTFHVHDDRL